MTIRGVPHDFWTELYADVKKAKPGAFLLGEAWIDAGVPKKNAQDARHEHRDDRRRGWQAQTLTVPFPKMAGRGIIRGHGLSPFLGLKAASLIPQRRRLVCFHTPNS